LDEGGNAIANITTANVANGTILYWTIEGVSGTINADDFVTALSGNVTINSNAASFTITVKKDQLKEGNESFLVRVRTGSTSGTIVATSNTVTINDTSFSTVFLANNKIIKVYQGTTEIKLITKGDEEIYKDN
jgi:hypothetical protein